MKMPVHDDVWRILRHLRVKVDTRAGRTISNSNNLTVNIPRHYEGSGVNLSWEPQTEEGDGQRDQPLVTHKQINIEVVLQRHNPIGIEDNSYTLNPDR